MRWHDVAKWTQIQPSVCRVMLFMLSQVTSISNQLEVREVEG